MTQIAPATAYGSQAHLTGRGGDDVLAAVALMVIDQYRAGHRAEAIRRAMALARAKRCAVHSLLRQVIRTQCSRYPQALTALAQMLGGPRDLHHPGWTPPWLTRSGRSAVAELVAHRAADADPLATPGAVHERLALEVILRRENDRVEDAVEAGQAPSRPLRQGMTGHRGPLLAR